MQNHCEIQTLYMLFQDSERLSWLLLQEGMCIPMKHCIESKKCAVNIFFER